MIKNIIKEFEKVGQKYQDKVIIFDLGSWELFKVKLLDALSQKSEVKG